MDSTPDELSEPRDYAWGGPPPTSDVTSSGFLRSVLDAVLASPSVPANDTGWFHGPFAFRGTDVALLDPQPDFIDFLSAAV